MLGIALQAVTASVSGCLARLSVFPLDVVQSKIEANPNNNIGTYKMMQKIVRKEGFGGLFTGCGVKVVNQMISSGISLGGYDILKTKNVPYGEDEHENNIDGGNLGAAFAAGGTAKFASIPRTSPKDPIIMANTSIGRAINHYRAALDKLKNDGKVTSKHHFLTTINMLKRYGSKLCRNGLLNCAEVVSYDYFKSIIISLFKAKDTVPVHFVSALFCGGFTVLTTAPYYSIRKRYYSAPPGMYRSFPRCIIDMFEVDGLKSFYPSLRANLIRTLVFNVVLWISYEQLKKLHPGKGRRHHSRHPG